MKEVTGVITAVRGQGFDLESELGVESFTLGMAAVLEAGDLPAVAANRIEVTVQYHDVPDDTHHVAMRIFPSTRPGFSRQAH